MNKIIEQIVNEIKLQIFNEVDKSNKTIIAIYPGRFQPMGRHHKAAYDWLSKQFGEKNTFIATSDKVEPQKSPLNFAEKKKIMLKHGVPSSQIIKVLNPYSPLQFIEAIGLDPKDTTVVYMIGEKDKGRLRGFKRLMVFNKTTYIPAKDLDNPYTYYVYAPHISYNIPSFGEMSGTNIRKALGDNDAKLAELKSRFKNIMGWFDAGIFNLVISKLNTKRSKIKEDINDWFRVMLNMSQEQFGIFLDVLQKEYGDTKDLLPIIRKFVKTGGKISDEEKRIFAKQMKNTAKIVGLGSIAAIPIPGTMLLIPVIVKLFDKFGVNILPESDEPKSKPLSIVRREFWNEVFTEVAKENNLINDSTHKVDTRQLLVCGGVAGHMTHPFEDFGLTFGDMKEMFRLGLSGEITVKGSPTEKLDGQNLFASFRGGKLYAARNKSDIKNGGMDYESIKTKFSGRGTIEEAFTFAFSDLEKAIQSLTTKQQEKIFQGGKAWMNLEVMYPKSQNIINYDGAFIVFHGVSLYNDNGEKVKDYPEYARTLAGMIKRVNANSQKTFKITKPKPIVVNKSKKFNERLNYFIGKLTTLQNKMKCSDTDTIGVWHQRWWETYIKKNTKESGLTIDKSIMEGLVKRWAFNDKSFSLNSTNIPDSNLLSWAKNTDKMKVGEQMQKNVLPFELLVLEFGSEVLKNVQSVMAINPDKTTKQLRADVNRAIQTLSSSTRLEDISVLKKQLKRIEGAGGINAIVPLEGIVFSFNGKTYKLTGAFAPINQLLNYFKFKT
jgi:hypothetical protein